VIHNGIDLDEYRSVTSTAALEKYGVNPREPYVLFVGRITRQKGIIHLVRAIESMASGFQVVLCAGAPDTPEIAAEMKAAVAVAQAKHGSVVWIDQMVSNKEKIELYSHASVFCCPSIYEPFGIINLEAMACETAVVATAVGGIKEVVVHGETGFLVPIEQMKESPFEATHPAKLSADLAMRINELMADPALRERMAKAGRRRVEEHFGWPAIARRTVDLYERVLPERR
jgi:glycogen synthase